MLVNWPPATAPSWPPPGYSNLEVSSWDQVEPTLQELNATVSNPTTKERRDYFDPARCDQGHTVRGVMVVWSNGTRYPFAQCTDGGHQQGLVLWHPYAVDASR